MTPPVVLAYAGYPAPEQCAVLIGSFLAQRRTSTLHLFVEHRYRAAWRRIESEAVRVAPVRRSWLLRRAEVRRTLEQVRAGRIAGPLDATATRLGMRSRLPLLEWDHVARLWFELRLLERRLAEAPWVFVCDARDVAFQGDFETPFTANITDAPLHLYAEAHNLGDPTDLFSLPEMRQLGLDVPPDRRGASVCSGTILGRPTETRELLSRMLGALPTPMCGTPRILDQGLLNFLVYGGELDDLAPAIHRVGEGGVVTCGGGAKHSPELVVDVDGASWNGRVPPVVHQFDRVPGLDAVFRERYAILGNASQPG